MTVILEKLKSALRSVEAGYHRLIILVNFAERSKPEIARWLKEYYDAKPLNLNLELSTRLFEYSMKQRQLKVTEIMEDIISGAPTHALLDRIDILFEPSLKTDAMSLLLSLSRKKTIIAFWNGTIKENKLYYAEPGYPEYKSYSIQDFVAIDTQPQESF